MTARFYVPEGFDHPKVELAGSEAHHLLHVLRCQVGDEVRLFDGRGGEATSSVQSVAKATVTLEITESFLAAQDPVRSIVLGTAVPKGDRFRWLVEKATEMGVDRLVPLGTARSVVAPGFGKLEKMRQTVIAACKQCGRSRLTEIDELTSWHTFVDNEFISGRAVVADHSGECVARSLCEPSHGSSQTVVLAVGPEGGFTGDELEYAVTAGANLVSLGPHVLRIETAAIAMVALFGLGSGLSGPDCP